MEDENKKPENPSVFPDPMRGASYETHQWGGTDPTLFSEGMELRDFFAAKLTDDFDRFPAEIQIIIVGEDPPIIKSNDGSGVEIVNEDSVGYAMWLAKGRAKWRYIQADAMLKERLITK